MSPKVQITTIGYGGWYPRGVARLIERFETVSPGFTISAFVNCLPHGAPLDVIEDGRDYTAYCLKPFALRETMLQDADIGILMDAAFYPIRHIQPLVDHIAATGYYLCKNGFKVGQWSSDRALRSFHLPRDKAFQIEEASSYCVGLDFRKSRSRDLVAQWCAYAADRKTFPGPHTNVCAEGEAREIAKNSGGRNPGWVSDDPRVGGHRHDQTALSVVAYRLGMDQLIERPKFTAYEGSQDETTVLCNRGGL